ncbi:hypothetical protein ACFL1Z_08200, partial [Thermodesulfobacteriota bacterium]
GEIDIDISGSSLLLTMDMLIQNNNINRVYKIENYQMSITERIGHTELYVNGRFYDSDYGYVDLTTTSVLLIYNYDDYPYSGQIVITGENGIDGGPTKARLTALSDTQCQVEADTTGDGLYDYDSGPILWTEL